MYSPLDQDIITYCDVHSSKGHEILEVIERNAHTKTLHPQMITGPLLAHFFKWLLGWVQPKNILEVGTFVGYGTTVFALYTEADAQIDTIEINPENHFIANQHFDLIESKNKINSVLGDAREWIQNQDKTWDFILIDAAKKDNIDYYNMLLPKLSSNGVMVIDNTLWKGKVLDENQDKTTQNINKLNRLVQEDPSVENLLLPLEDGITLIRKK